MTKPKILIADSEAMFTVAAAYILHEQGYEVQTARESAAVLQQAARHQPDLVILDAALPTVDGAPLPCLLRQRQAMENPRFILALGENNDESACVSLLESGADDYLAKPFGMREFLARVSALLRRAQVHGEVSRPGELRFGPFKLDLDQLRLAVVTEAGPRAAHLTPRETQIMEQLMRGAGEFVSRDRLSARVWGEEQVSEGTLNTLEVHLRSLRKKVHAASGQDWHIETKRGIGVRLMTWMALSAAPLSEALELMILSF